MPTAQSVADDPFLALNNGREPAPDPFLALNTPPAPSGFEQINAWMQRPVSTGTAASVPPSMFMGDGMPNPDVADAAPSVDPYDLTVRLAQNAVQGAGAVVSGVGDANRLLQNKLVDINPLAGPDEAARIKAQNAAQNQPVVAYGQDITNLLGDYYEPNKARDQDIASKFAGFVGQTAPVIASGPFAGVTGPLLLGEQARQAALKKQKIDEYGAVAPDPDSQEVADAKFTLGTTIGALANVVPANAFLRHVVSPEAVVSTPIRAALTEMGVHAGAAGATGAAMDATLQAVTEDKIDWERVAETGLLTSAMGAIGGGLKAAKAEQLARTDREYLFTLARKLGFQGNTIDELRDWHSQQEQAREILKKQKARDEATPVVPLEPQLAAPTEDATGGVEPPEQPAPAPGPVAPPESPPTRPAPAPLPSDDATNGVEPPAPPVVIPPVATGTSGVTPAPTPIEQGAGPMPPVATPPAPVVAPEQNIPIAQPAPPAGASYGDRVSAAADAILSHVRSGQVLDWRGLFNIADNAFGGTQAQGKYTPKDAYDAAELAMNRLVASAPAVGAALRNDDPGVARNAAKSIALTTALFPTQTKRTEEQEKLQQFSTVPPLAFAANWVANLQPSDNYLEPSAGIGGLAAFAKAAGVANIHTNEISPRRAEILARSGISNSTTPYNGEQLHALMQPKIEQGAVAEPSVVVMNPPFSRGAESGKHATAVGAQHVEEALKLLPPGGRLVAIVGEGMKFGTPHFNQWWARIRQQYNVRANVGVSGEEYRKYGTTFDNQLLVIDKTGPTTESPVAGSVAKVDELFSLLKGVRDARVFPSYQAGPSPAPQPTGAVARPPAEQGGIVGTGQGGQPAVQPPTGPVAGPGATTVRTPGNRPAPTGGVQLGPHTGVTGTSVEPTGQGTPAAGTAPGQLVGNGESGGQRTDAPATGLSVGKADPQQAHHIADDDEAVFSAYRPSKIDVPGAKPHPTPLVESAAMASVAAPDPTYTPNLPQELLTSGKLSDAQIENVIYAGQAHEKILPSGERRGYFIGDGTGVGKGRQVAAIFEDNFNQGRTKGVWISKSSGLVDDARRDMRDIGMKEDLLVPINKAAESGTGSIKLPKGIVFSTYTSLAKGHEGLTKEGVPRKREGSKKTRLEQIVEWLGPDFDGVIAFDEAHQAGNAVAIKTSRGMKDPSNTGIAVVDLQRMLPKARVVYVSATGATEPSNLSYADRLGIWGPRTPFPNKLDFFQKISAGGISAMEIIARDLKSLGGYMARTLSFDGVKFARLEHQLTPDQLGLYDSIAGAWQSVFQNMDAAMANSGAAKNPRARAAARAAFFGSQQRFFNQLLTALQMPTIIEDAKAQLAAGKSVIFQLVNTNEATQERELAKAQTEEHSDLEDLDLSPRDILMQYIDKSFPTVKYQEVQDPNNPERTTWVPVVDENGNPVNDPDAVARKYKLLMDLKSLKVPENPLEMILNEFGWENVAEITGRSQRVVIGKKPDGTTGKIIQNRTEPMRRVEAQEYQDKKKRILVFSGAGGTGYSYHPSRRAINQEERQHYLVQAGWRADAALQGFGRSHRSDQAQPPFYKLAMTNIDGHKRFVSTIARRLAQLGALTSGERKSAGQGMFSEKDNLESSYASDALTRFFNDLYKGDIEDVNFGELTRKMGFGHTTPEGIWISSLVDPKTGGLNQQKLPDIPQFLNRLLALRPAEQNKIFNEFFTRLEKRIDNAKADGSFDPGTQTLRAARIDKISDEVVYRHPESTAQTRLVEVNAVNPVRFTLFNEIGALGTTPVERYVRNIGSGRVYALKEGPPRTLSTGSVVDTFRRIPTHGQVDLMPQYEFNPDKFETLTTEQAEKAWADEIAASAKEKGEKKTFVVGSFLPIWDRLQLAHPKIFRFVTSKGEPMLGALVPPKDVDAVRRRLGAGANKKDEAEVIRSIIEDGQSYELANGWRLQRVRVSGEHRIEVIGMGWHDTKDFTDNIGGFMEKIGYTPRYFMPTGGEAGVAAMRNLLAKSPLIEPMEEDDEPTHRPPAGITATRQRDMAAPAGVAGTGVSVPGATSASSHTAPTVSTNPIIRLFRQIQAIVAPTTLGAPGEHAAGLLRQLLAEKANEMARAANNLNAARAAFDKTPVLPGWTYNPAEPLPHNYLFIDAYESGNVASLPPDMRGLAAELHRLNQSDLARVHALGTGALKDFYENYFPHIWKDPARAKQVMAGLLGRRPLEGPKSFLIKRTHDLTVKGLEAGLVPAHDNPIDLWLAKKNEVERYILGVKFFNQAKAAGLIKFNYYATRRPEGWSSPRDPSFTQWAPPWVKIKEAFDAGMREKTLEALAKLGVPHERLVKLGGQRWGYEEDSGLPGSERIVSKFGGPDFVIWHELGHALDNRYRDMRTALFGGTPLEVDAARARRNFMRSLTPAQMRILKLDDELRALADARGAPKAYARKTEEKMAVVLQAYLHAPELMKKLAPTVQGAMAAFIYSHPELMVIEDIRPTLRLGVGETEMPVGGMVKLGDWIMPDAATRVVDNFLSPGLGGFVGYQALRAITHTMTAAQLSISGFHAGFTTIDVIASHLGLAMRDAAHGNAGAALTGFAHVPVSWLTNPFRGYRLKQAVLQQNNPGMLALVKALEAGGGRISQDKFWQTAFTRRMKRAFAMAAQYGKRGRGELARLNIGGALKSAQHAEAMAFEAAIQLPFALIEQAARPILEKLVPLQKLGVFAAMAAQEMRMNPTMTPEQLRERMQLVWQSVENRMGEIAYDNYFYNHLLKDVAMLAFRAPGWQQGKILEGGGAAVDTGKALWDAARLKKPEVTHKMAYVVGLVIVLGAIGGFIHYLLTGRRPQGRDWFQPQTGEKDRYGNPVRLNLPTYGKDMMAYSHHPLTAAAHSLSPILSSTFDALSNKDFYGTQIYNPDDPLVQKLTDMGKWAGSELVPFSFSAAMKLYDDGSPGWKLIAPFFGLTPVPLRDTMSPAQNLAAEIMQGSMPQEAMTLDQAARGKLVRDIVHKFKNGDQSGAAEDLTTAVQTQALAPNAASLFFSKIKYTPLQFQVNHFTPEQAMRVWRLANPAEQEELRLLVGRKINAADSLPFDTKMKMMNEVTGSISSQTPAPALAR